MFEQPPSSALYGGQTLLRTGPHRQPIYRKPTKGGTLMETLREKFVENLTYPEAFKRITDSMVDLFTKKNSDYGSSFASTWQKLGPISGITRIADKFNRLCNLITNPNGQQIKTESVEDTLLDLANYAVLALIEFKKSSGEFCVME